jgi:hypothetical protein
MSLKGYALKGGFKAETKSANWSPMQWRSSAYIPDQGGQVPAYVGIYPSRLNGETNLAVYDRAVRKLVAPRTHILRRAPGLAQVLDDLAVAMV